MSDIFNIKEYKFPYTDYRFPGQSEGERILFVTRESDIMHKLRLFALVIASIFLLALGLFLISMIEQYLPQLSFLKTLMVIVIGLFVIVGYWFIQETWRKSIFIITTRRLTKIIYTTPFTWYQFSLGLDEIEDTGSYGSTYFEALFNLGYFVARSGAAAIKNFKIINITYARDLHNYVNKLLYAFKHFPNRINEFRPFAPFLKPGERDELFKKYPEYKTEFE
jgi:hypothetical protein